MSQAYTNKCLRVLDHPLSMRWFVSYFAWSVGRSVHQSVRHLLVCFRSMNTLNQISFIFCARDCSAIILLLLLLLLVHLFRSEFCELKRRSVFFRLSLLTNAVCVRYFQIYLSGAFTIQTYIHIMRSLLLSCSYASRSVGRSVSR